MEKNWLIRTKNNHILGPVSKQKVRELLDKGSIKGDDELSCGNGYWFFIREKELVEKYVAGEIPQGFNPVSEADTVLSKPEVQVDGDNLVPCEDDLAFPDMEEDVSLKVPQQDDLEYPEVEIDEVEAHEDTLAKLRSKASKKKIVNSKSKSNKKKVATPNKKKGNKIKPTQTQTIQKSFLNQNTLYILATAFFILALLAFYFRRRIVKEFIEARSFIVQPVYAQAIPDAVKKKLTI